MFAINFLRLTAIVLALTFAGMLPAAETESPAILLDKVQQAPLVAVTQVGQSLVAVGDHGVVALSDDGQVWQQAKNVPVDDLLTALTFVNDKQGWAVGHGGVVLRTEDGGHTWALQQRLDGGPVLLSVWFESASHGMVVGAYGYAAQTNDGGVTWHPTRVGGEGDDHHLNHIFAGRDGTLFIAAEAGNAYRSVDHGMTWHTLDTGVNGSLWSGTGLRDGRILLLGMSGRVLLGDRLGNHWQALASGTDEAITSVIQLADGRVTWVGNGGVVALSDTAVELFNVQQREDRLNLSALASNKEGELVLFGSTGVIPHDTALGDGK